MWHSYARQTLALRQNHTCLQCTLNAVARSGRRRLQTGRTLHLDSQAENADASLAIVPPTSQVLPPPPLVRRISTKRGHLTRAVSRDEAGDRTVQDRHPKKTGQWRRARSMKPSSTTRKVPSTRSSARRSKTAPENRRKGSPRISRRNHRATKNSTSTSRGVESVLIDYADLTQQLDRARQSAVDAVRNLREAVAKTQLGQDGLQLSSTHDTKADMGLPKPSKGATGASIKNGDQAPRSRIAELRKSRKVDKLPFSLLPLPKRLQMRPVEIEQENPPRLSYGLDRVLFNPGVYRLQDPRSGVYNFDPYLEEIMPVDEFDFDAIKKYVTSSKDDILTSTAKKQNKKYTGSTSSMTNILSHLHFLLSSWRAPNMSMLSGGFPAEHKSYTNLSRAPAATMMVLKDNGIYAIDADKEFSTSSVLSLLGQSMERLLTLDTDAFEQYRKSRSKAGAQPQEEVSSYHYTVLGDFIFRSQLDAYDPRLPGRGIFDVKTRAVVSVRMDAQNPQQGSGYEIVTNLGEWESFEREYYDLIRAAFLKYSLQVRMGRMDGIFVAYHNTKRIFGFQYIPLSEMDFALHGQTDPTLGDLEFQYSMGLLNELLNKATERFPKQSLRLHFETRGTSDGPFMYFIAEPVSDADIEAIQQESTSDEAFLETLDVKEPSVSEIEDSPTQDLSQISKAMAEAQQTLDHSCVMSIEVNPPDSTDVVSEEHDMEMQPASVPSYIPTPLETASVVTWSGEDTLEDLHNEQTAEDDSTADLVDHAPMHSREMFQTLEGAMDASMRNFTEGHEHMEDTDEDGPYEAEALKTNDGSPPSADPVFGSPSDTAESGKDDLLVFKVRLQHQVGSKISSSPPDSLSSNSPEWRVSYHLEEIDSTRGRKVYDACKTRRRKILDSHKALAGAYIAKLRELSSKGQKRRSDLNAKNASLKKVVFTPSTESRKGDS